MALESIENIVFKHKNMVAFEHVENETKTKVLRWNVLKTHGKPKVCVGMYSKLYENLGFIVVAIRIAPG